MCALPSENYYTYNTPVGRITIASDGSYITCVAFGKVKLSGTYAASKLTNTASTQLLEYLAGKRREFNLPLRAEGTAFQKEVWKVVSSIPYGETLSYGQVAAKVGNPRATRAVGMANNRNPLPILIPCHRVIGANGKPVGYAGGIKIKEFLLNIERS